MSAIEEIRKQIPTGMFIYRGENKNYSKQKIKSTLYRQQEKELEGLKELDIFEIENLDFPGIEKNIIYRARTHFSEQTSNLEILTQLQHHGGKTTLIDFSKNFLIALFFACSGENKNEDGYLYFLDTKEITNSKKIYEEKEGEKNTNDLLLQPTSKNNRPIFQSSIFVHSPKGFLDKENIKEIKIEQREKNEILKELKTSNNIHEDTIYNDLQGFIANENNYKSAQTYFYIGLSFGQKERYEEAIKNYDKAIALKPNYVEAYNNRGNAKSKLREDKEAIKDYDKAIELDPNYVVAHYNRGDAKNKLGDCVNDDEEKIKFYEEAVLDYKKVLELNPDDLDSIFAKDAVNTVLLNPSDLIFIFAKIELEKLENKINGLKNY